MGEPAARATSDVLRVSELTRYLRYIVEHDDLLSGLAVQGEISDLTRSAGGHVYFTLKDAQSQIGCVLFRREAQQNLETLRDMRKGLSVRVYGFLTLYEPRGTYQLYVERVVSHGEGVLARQVEELRARLQREGLFAEDRKRPLPPFPRSLALVTSPGSQAYHDVLHRLRTQYPFVRVIEAGASVQGPGAAEEMSMAIDIVNRLTDAELILLVRGGGAPEELAAFNDERLARTIFGSQVPVVTGIGHETDSTLADAVADRRAATPSLAAAAAVPDVAALAARIQALHGVAGTRIGQRIREERRHLARLNQGLMQADPSRRLRVRRQRVVELQRLQAVAMQAVLRSRRQRLEAARARLETLDPLAILARGYAVVTDSERGTVVGRVDQAPPGAALRVRVADGEFSVRVEQR